MHGTISKESTGEKIEGLISVYTMEAYKCNHLQVSPKQKNASMAETVRRGWWGGSPNTLNQPIRHITAG